MSTDETQEDFLRNLRSGDAAAFEELVHSLTPTIYRLAFAMMGNEHDAKDAVQETFIKVYKSLPLFRGDASLRTWVSHIAANTCKDALRALGRYQVLRADDEEAFLQLPDPAPTPEEALVTKERQLAVEKALESLPTEYKLVITLCDLQGFSYIEAAQALACPLGTLKSRLSRARTYLLKILSQNRELFAPSDRQTDRKEAPKE